MDKKISEFATASNVLGTDIIPIVSGGNNLGVSVGVLALNFPNLGNKGITKNAIAQAIQSTIPLTNTLVALGAIGSSHTLADGSIGQEITLISLGACNVQPASSYITNISMVAGSSVTLVYVTSVVKWVVKSSHNCNIS